MRTIAGESPRFLWYDYLHFGCFWTPPPFLPILIPIVFLVHSFFKLRYRDWLVLSVQFSCLSFYFISWPSTCFPLQAESTCLPCDSATVETSCHYCFLFGQLWRYKARQRMKKDGLSVRWLLDLALSSILQTFAIICFEMYPFFRNLKFNFAANCVFAEPTLWDNRPVIRRYFGRNYIKPWSNFFKFTIWEVTYVKEVGQIRIGAFTVSGNPGIASVSQIQFHWNFRFYWKTTHKLSMFSWAANSTLLLHCVFCPTDTDFFYSKLSVL